MISIKEKCGLPIKLKGVCLIFGKGMKEVKPEVRTLSQMRPVLKDKKSKGREMLYYMYREVCMKKDESLFKKMGIRYDITILEPGKIGKELVKTFGHFHPLARKNATYPEIYEVIHGKAEYAMQKEDDFVVIKAKPGDKVPIPPNYGHVTVNVGKSPLVMANLVYSHFSADYGAIEKKGGIMYYRTGKWEKNNSYKNIPQLRYVKPLKVKKPLYSLFIEDPRSFMFLKEP